MRILVLEDDDVSRDALIRILQNIRPDIEADGAACLSEALGLLYQDTEYQLFLLDVNLVREDIEDVSGITFAKEIRDIYRYELTPVIMITSVGSMEMEAYRQIHCYQYIVKPYEEEGVRHLVLKVLAHLETEEEIYVTVKKDGINYQINCDEIMYIQAVPRGVMLYLKEETVQVPYLSLKQLMQKLPGGHFIQCHRMFTVNRDYIEYCDLVNQFIKIRKMKEKIDIGVTYKGEVRRLMNG